MSLQIYLTKHEYNLTTDQIRSLHGAAVIDEDGSIDGEVVEMAETGRGRKMS